MLINKNDLVLFQGDSITDAGRTGMETENLGQGYPLFVASLFSAMYPEMNVRFLNRGVSGNRVKDLKARWEEDCISLKPDVVSILIGINDCWRRYDSNDPTSVEAYADSYRFILSRIKESLPDTRVIICEPFVLPEPPDRREWRVDLDPKIHATRELAREFNTVYIPFDGLFAQACAKQPPVFWAPDGVHPSQNGHAFMAIEWLKAAGAL